MKRLSIIFSIFIISLLSLSAVVNAQEATQTPEPVTVIDEETGEEFTAQKAYKDYVYTYDLYKKAHSDYLLAKSQYLQAQTLASKTKAQNATVDMLQARDDVMSTYLTALRIRLSEAEGVDNTVRNGLYSRLDSHVDWFQNHKIQVTSAGTLEDLVQDSEEAHLRYLEVEPLVFEILSTIPLGKIEILKSKINSILAEIKIKTEEIRARGDHDTTITERWIIETENKIARGLDKQIEAQQLIFTFQNAAVDQRRRTNYGATYEEIIGLLQESNQFFREASSFMGEIMWSIKTSQ